MRYVVTGAAGFIGSHLARELVERGHDVVGVDCFTDYYDVELKEENARGLDVVRADLAEDRLDDIVEGAHGVFHLAGQPGARSFGEVFPLYVERNVLASQRVFAAAARAGVRVVYASSSSIYGDAETYPTSEETPPLPVSPYAITKLAGEHLARAYARDFALRVVVLRYFTVYGPRQRPDMAFARMVDALANERTFELYGDGGQSRSFTYVGDIVDGTIAAMERGPAGATYNLGGGQEATMREAIAVLELVAGRRLEVVYSERAAGDVRRTAPDLRRAREELDWEARTPLEEGLHSQWSWAAARVGAR